MPIDKPLKPITWLGDSLDRLRCFPEDVKDDVGAALMWAQMGDKHADAKPMRGFGGASILEIVENHDGNTYRAVYTVRFKENLCAALLPEEIKARERNAETRHQIDQ
jgi:phage-related protein